MTRSIETKSELRQAWERVKLQMAKCTLEKERRLIDYAIEYLDGDRLFEEMSASNMADQDRIERNGRKDRS